MRRSRRILLETGVLGAALCASAMIFVLSVAAPIAAHDRDDDRCAQNPPCQCDCACWCGPGATCACEITPQTCGRLRARECKAAGLRPGCRRCVSTKE